MIEERRLPKPSPGNDCNDVNLLICPRTIQEGDILLSTKKITSSNRQSGYGNIFRCRSYWRLASTDTRSGRGCLLQVLTSDSTPPLDCVPYRRNGVQKFGGILKALRR